LGKDKRQKFKDKSWGWEDKRQKFKDKSRVGKIKDKSKKIKVGFGR
jgi:hypothetical protein